MSNLGQIWWKLLSASIPMGFLPAGVKAKLDQDWMISAFGFKVPLLGLLGSAFLNNSSVNAFYSPDDPHAFGFSFGLGSSWSGVKGVSPTSNISLGWSYYWQEAPGTVVPFR